MYDSSETEEGRKSVRRALTLLKQSGVMYDGEPLWKHALDVLPLDFALSAQLCANSLRQFSLKHIGRPARVHASSELCAWCDVAILTERQKSAQGPRLIADALGNGVNNLGILLAGCNTLTYDFRRDAANKATAKSE